MTRANLAAPAAVNTAAIDNSVNLNLATAEKAYKVAVERLSEYNQSEIMKIFQNLQIEITGLIEQTTLLKTQGENVLELINILNATYYRLKYNPLTNSENKMSSEAYTQMAYTVKGSPSTGMNVLGGIMVAIAIIAYAGIIVLVPSIGVVACGVVGTLCGAAGYGIFSKNKPKGLSSNMLGVNSEQLRKETLEASISLGRKFSEVNSDDELPNVAACA